MLDVVDKNPTRLTRIEAIHKLNKMCFGYGYAVNISPFDIVLFFKKDKVVSVIESIFYNVKQDSELSVEIGFGKFLGWEWKWREAKNYFPKEIPDFNHDKFMGELIFGFYSSFLWIVKKDDERRVRYLNALKRNGFLDYSLKNGQYSYVISKKGEKYIDDNAIFLSMPKGDK